MISCSRGRRSPTFCGHLEGPHWSTRNCPVFEVTYFNEEANAKSLLESRISHFYASFFSNDRRRFFGRPAVIGQRCNLGHCPHRGRLGRARAQVGPLSLAVARNGASFLMPPPCHRRRAGAFVDLAQVAFDSPRRAGWTPPARHAGSFLGHTAAHCAPHGFSSWSTARGLCLAHEGGPPPATRGVSASGTLQWLFRAPNGRVWSSRRAVREFRAILPFFVAGTVERSRPVCFGRRGRWGSCGGPHGRRLLRVSGLSKALWRGGGRLGDPLKGSHAWALTIGTQVILFRVASPPPPADHCPPSPRFPLWLACGRFSSSPSSAACQAAWHARSSRRGRSPTELPGRRHRRLRPWRWRPPWPLPCLP